MNPADAQFPRTPGNELFSRSICLSLSHLENNEFYVCSCSNDGWKFLIKKHRATKKERAGYPRCAKCSAFNAVNSIYDCVRRINLIIIIKFILIIIRNALDNQQSRWLEWRSCFSFGEPRGDRTAKGRLPCKFTLQTCLWIYEIHVLLLFVFTNRRYHLIDRSNVNHVSCWRNACNGKRAFYKKIF